MGFGSESAVFSGFCWVFCCFFFLCLVQKSGTQAAIDPVERQALNSIFQEWGVSADANIWNFSGEPCSGAAIDSTDIINPNFNPGIKCSCSSDNGTTCHIIRMKVYAMSITGTIPEAIVNLTQMMDLNLAQNYLTGPLPSYIGNLTAMQYLSVGTNLFSGTVPKELGNLRKLVSLSISSSNFSGPLPAELGNLTNLQQLYIDSAGVSGEIPSTFANLQNLQILWASDNAFTGMIPNFFGTLTNLTTLRFQGNSFEGPIPSNLANLIKLTDLRISDLSNGSSSLSFIKDMKALSILVLRNNMISDTLPSNIADYQSLAHLDLSFNNIKGGLPNSLFNLTSLSYLFLGNNSLSGSLPSNKSSRLLNVDLSYNGLSGSFPSWINEQNLQLNLLGNSFVIDSSNSSALPSGLNCLQRNFPCNRASPRYSEFAIKCGGLVLTSSSGVTFDSENEILGPTSYYMIDTERWAVSNTGRFVDAKNVTYTRNSSSQFENTLDTKLFQTTRVSPGSLRYFGLGLENGNYTVNLHFAEIEFLDTRSWESLGRRVFNIYIQGNLVWKDFDIRKEVGGKSLTAVVKNARAAVSENYLEIHLFWAGKGTCCIPTQGSYGPLISAISVTPDFIPTVSNRPPTTTSKKNTTGLIVGVAVAAGVIGFIAVLAILVLRQRRKRWNLESDEEFMSMGTKPNIFSYSELRTATEDFNPANKLGEGGFGPVYKGTLLSDGRIVAVKQLSVASHQGRSQFLTEIATISAVQHRNLVKLYGCCIESDKRLLVYEYLENRSLDQALFGKGKMNLNWATRFDICLGTARGLAYLHEESSVRIVHRDVKASNILLDGDLTPKISDFGLAKLYDDKKTHISTRVAGTIGYLAPEYAMRGHLTEKADVFGFGVVSLEILSGRPNSDTNLDTEQIYLLEWAWHLHEKNCELELVDQTLDEFDEAEAIRLIGIALLCTQASPMLRPSMSRVVAMLSGDIEVTAVTTRPGYLADWQFKDIGSFVSEDASKTSFTGTTTSKLSTSSTGMGASANPSPVYVGQPLLEDVIGEGS